VPAEALDMVKSGQVAGSVELMLWENKLRRSTTWGCCRHNTPL
jgi:hypothetical protein